MDESSFQKMIDQEEKHWWFSSRRKIISTLISKKIKKENVGDILEVGCGSGGNLETLTHFGNLSAIELNDNARKVAQSRELCPVKKGYLPNGLNTEKAFDLVCLFDVLEHIDEDEASIKSIKKLVVDNGHIVITVPAFMFLWSDHDEIHHHKRRYTKKQLVDMLKANGFTIRYSSYFNSLLFPMISGVRLLHRLLKRKGGDVEESSPLVNGILSSIFSFEKYILPKISMPLGVSIFIIAQKK